MWRDTLASWIGWPWDVTTWTIIGAVGAILAALLAIPVARAACGQLREMREKKKNKSGMKVEGNNATQSFSGQENAGTSVGGIHAPGGQVYVSTAAAPNQHSDLEIVRGILMGKDPKAISFSREKIFTVLAGQLKAQPFDLDKSLAENPEGDKETQSWLKKADEAMKAGNYARANIYLEDALKRSDELIRQQAHGPRMDKLYSLILILKIRMTQEQFKQDRDQTFLNKTLLFSDQILLEFGEDQTPVVRSGVAWALLSKGMILGQFGKIDEALNVYEEILHRFGSEGENPAIRPGVALALLFKGMTLSQLEKIIEALAVFEEVFSRFGEDKDPVIRPGVALALLGKGVILWSQGEAQKALDAFDKVLCHFGKDENPVIYLGITRAVLMKCIILTQLGRSDDASVACEEALHRLNEDKEPDSSMLFYKGIILWNQGKRQEALGIFDEVLSRSDENKNPANQQLVATVLLTKGDAFRQLGKNTEAAASFEEVTRRFDKDNDPVIRDWVERARQRLAELKR